MGKATVTNTTSEPHPKRKPETRPEDVLPFVCIRPNGEGRDFWAPRPTGDYIIDCDLGALWGEALVPLLRVQPDLLKYIVLGMARRGQGGLGGADQGLIVGLMEVVGRAFVQRAAPTLAFSRLEPVRAGRDAP